MKRLSWKYMAGLVDGEGCIDFQTHKFNYTRVDGSRMEETYLQPRLRVTLREDGKFLLEMAKDQFGGNLCVSMRSRDNANWGDAYCWQMQVKTELRCFLQNTANHMFLKKEQALFIIWFLDHLSGKQVRQAGFEAMPLVRQCAREELKAMKRDPQRLSERAIRRMLEILANQDSIKSA